MLKKKLFKFLIWIGVFNLAITGSLLTNFQQAKADEIKNLPTVQFDKTFAEGSAISANVNIAIDLSAVSSDDVTVDYAVISDGTTAVDGTDYNLVGDSLTIPSGDLSADIKLNIINTHLCEKAKTIEIGLSAPINAVLGDQTEFTYKILEDDCNLQTTLTTDPLLPDGQNGWFITDLVITLTAVNQVKIYYQWDATACGQWLKYSDPFLAPEGEHTLYFYSAKYHHKEEVQSKIFKVDLTPPAVPQISATIDDHGVVHLSWQAVSDAQNYKIWRTDTPQVIAILAFDQLTFTDSSVVRGQTYTYNVLAVDEAGNISPVATTSIVVPPPPVVILVNPTPPAYAQSKVSKSISDGVSTTKKETTPEIAGTTNTTNTPTFTTSESTPKRNWNQILLAISILIIAIGAAIGGYYGYEWWMTHRDEPPKNEQPKGKSRW